jgi:WD40 repeat protein
MMQVKFYTLISKEIGPISIVEMLFSSNLILLVGLNEFCEFSPQKFTFWNSSTNSVLCSSWPFTSKITMAKINKNRTIITERNFLHIYTTGDMKILHSIDMGKVGLGKLVLSPNAEKNNFACFSSSEDDGVVKVYDLLYLIFKNSIRAHKSQILKIAINNKGELLCTCSLKGTIIRIFSLAKGEKLFTFKRGVSTAFIYSMNFSNENDRLIVSSDTGTIHIFNLKNENETK